MSIIHRNNGRDNGHAGTISIELTVNHHLPPQNKRRPYRVHCSDDTGDLMLVFFHAQESYLNRILPPGERRVVSGRLELFHDIRQMTHPDHIVAVGQEDSLPAVEPVYPLTTGLTPKPLAKAIAAALAEVAELAEWQDRSWLEKQSWPGWRAALLGAHKRPRQHPSRT